MSPDFRAQAPSFAKHESELLKLFLARVHHQSSIEADRFFDGGIAYMPLAKRLFADDEELGKKDDDHRPAEGAMVTSALLAWRPRRKRILIGIFVLYFLYLFIKYIPRDVPPVSERIDTRFGTPVSPRPHVVAVEPAPPGPPLRPSTIVTEHYYDGPIKFYDLGSTLGFGTASSKPSRNVLFAAASLKSASQVLPLACDMSKQARNNVHFAIMGREEIAIEELKQVNGINDADCAIHWHDGRPDYAPYSSNLRMELSTRAALGHIHTSMRLRAVLTDISGSEDDFFTKAINQKAKELGITTIKLPATAIDRLQWMMRLDSDSLSAVNDLQIDILVHAPAESSGSLIRLLQSLQNADYFGLPYPRLTVELPARVDVFTSNFLSRFRWPPGSSSAESTLTLRHRVHPARLSAVEASIRTIESYYPSLVPTSHVLVLAAQAELAPLYYHYLLFSLLEYKYSGSASWEVERLLGISLELPTQHLNGSVSFSPPVEDDLSRPSPLFLWQAPNSNAALYFGDKWLEFHSFLSNRFTVQPNLVTESQTHLISERYPAWMGYLLELVRARGYFMLYPAFSSLEASAVVTLHTDLYQPPEEFVESKAPEPDASELEAAGLVEGATTLTASSEASTLSRSREATTLVASSILPLLFRTFSPALDSRGAFSLPTLTDLRILSFGGERLSRIELSRQAESYAEDFSLHTGGCRTDSARMAASSWTADDLFCLEGHLGGSNSASAG